MSEKVGLSSSSCRDVNLTQILPPPTPDPPPPDRTDAPPPKDPTLSKKTVRLLAKLYSLQFGSALSADSWVDGQSLDGWRLYTFLSDHGFGSEFCNVAWLLSDPRALQHFILRLETGESVRLYHLPSQGQPASKIGQYYLNKLALALIDRFNRLDSSCLRPVGTTSLLSALQVDGVNLPSSHPDDSSRME